MKSCIKVYALRIPRVEAGFYLLRIRAERTGNAWVPHLCRKALLGAFRTTRASQASSGRCHCLRATFGQPRASQATFGHSAVEKRTIVARKRNERPIIARERGCALIVPEHRENVGISPKTERESEAQAETESLISHIKPSLKEKTCGDAIYLAAHFTLRKPLFSQNPLRFA